MRSLRATTLGLPGPSTWEMARAFGAIRDNPVAFLERTQQRYGDLVAFPVPGAPVLLLNDPVDVRQVLQTGSRAWTKRTIQYSALARVTGPGLLASSEDGWLDRRRVAQPAFHHGRLDVIADGVRSAATKAVSAWAALPAEGSVVDVDGLAMRMTLDVIGRTLFDRDLAATTERLVHATDEAAELVVATARSVLPVPGVVPTRTNRRLRAAVTALDAICRELVTERRLRGVAEGDTDLLGLLIAAGLPDRAVRDELVTMVVAGHETVASALTWTLMLLAEHPRHQDRLRAEIRSRPVTDVRQLRRALPWTSAVVDEALRLYPPGWVVSRRASLPDTIGARQVPAGTMAIISPWLLHRRPTSWPDPEAFRPERFLGDRSRTARADYVPFGLGPRLCIGRDFALAELVVILSVLLAGHEVRPPPGWTRPQLDAFVTLRSRGGLRLVVSPTR